ncbi:MAG: hypothetical protein WAL95_00965 [Candidatus Acidiferrales bacterium]
MQRHFVTGIQSAAVLITALLILSTPALAGPPLVCHPINIGSAQSLPWSSTTWNLSGQETYNIDHLVADTLALLAPNTPVLVRMETIRRAVLYSQTSPIVAKELFSAVESRTTAHQYDALAAFDFGYLIETYRQADLAFRMSHKPPSSSERLNPAVGLDGYTWVKKATSIRGEDPAMEFAAALITTENSKQDYQEHMQKAKSGAGEDSLLAQNIASHF